MGFTSDEIKTLLKNLNVNEEKFNEAMGVNTCAIIDGQIISYHIDIIKGLVCVFENRQQNSMEWD